MEFMKMKLFHKTISYLYSVQNIVIFLTNYCISYFSVTVMKYQDQEQLKEESVGAYGSRVVVSLMVCRLQGKAV